MDFTRLRFSREAIYLFIYLFLSTVKYKTKQKPNQNLSLAIKVLGAQKKEMFLGASLNGSIFS